MKKLLLLPFLCAMLMQTSYLAASAHSYGWYQRHEARAYRCGYGGYGGYGYNRGFNGYGGYPGGYYNPGLLGGIHRFFNGYYR